MHMATFQYQRIDPKQFEMTEIVGNMVETVKRG